MGQQQITKQFRFLDLPPELRNRIYNYVFEDTSTTSIELFKYTRHVSKPTITTVCHQIRLESIGLLREAQRNFWKDHKWIIPFDSKILNKADRDKLLLECDAIPPSARIQHMIFQTEFQRTIDGRTVHLNIEAHYEHGGSLEWTVDADADADEFVNSTFSFQQIAKMATDHLSERTAKYLWKLQANSNFLDVKACAEIFCEPFRLGTGASMMNALCLRLGHSSFSSRV